MANILYVIGSLDLGGAERHLCQVLPGLKERSLTPSVFCLDRKGSLAPALEDAGIAIYTPDEKGGNPFFRLCRIFFSLKKYIAETKPDVVHLFLPKAYLLGGLCAFFFPRIRFVMSRRSLNYYQKKYPFIGWIESFLHRRMDMILGNSKAVVHQLAAEKAPADRLFLLYNGIDLAPFAEEALPPRADTRKELGIAERSLVFIMIANLFAYKGHADLFTALAAIRGVLPRGWRLLLVGRDAGEEEALRQQAEEAGLTEHILFLGPRSDIPALLAASDIGLSCSHEEGFSNAVLEMMAAGLPMVATNAGGNAEALIHKKAGLIVPVKAPHSLASALTCLMDPHKRDKMGACARKRVEENFSLSHCIAAYETRYRALLNKQE